MSNAAAPQPAIANYLPKDLEWPTTGSTPIDRATFDYRRLVIPAYNPECAPRSACGVQVHFLTLTQTPAGWVSVYGKQRGCLGIV